MQTKRLLWIVALGPALTLALLMALSPSPEVVRAASKDWFVETGGTGDCTQANPCALQMAVDQAGDSDTILVAGGVYTGTGAAVITITKSITIHGGWDGAPTGAVVRRMSFSILNRIELSATARATTPHSCGVQVSVSSIGSNSLQQFERGIWWRESP